MASPILHIKDSYYFEVPKSVWPQHFSGKEEFVGARETWLRLDPDFQAWEADRFYEKYAALKANPEPKEQLLREYEAWKHDHHHAGKPFWRFLAEDHDRDWYQERLESSSSFGEQWRAAVEETSGSRALEAYRSTGPQWSNEKLDAYARHLSGKILIPQPFARLRNLYEKEWGFAISKFMIIEVGVALVLWGIFSWLGRNVSTGDRPRGALWNLLESIVVFVRDEIARPVIGHEAPHPAPVAAEAVAPGVVAAGAREQLHGEAGHEHHAHHEQPEHGYSEDSAQGHGSGHDHHHDPRFDADRFVPLLLTIFFFVLGCNLSGMIPWVGAPTGEWATTSALAFVTFGTGVVFGMVRFGPVGYFLNQIPGMDLPTLIGIPLKGAIFLIEILGLLIKHMILSVRLLANMVAGHIVLLSVMALAFSLEGAASDWWPLTATISVVGATLLSCLELFVACLQAYIFTFLSAMFIGAAIHHH